MKKAAPSEYRTVSQIAEEFPFTVASLRYLIFHSDKNGLDKVIRRIGSKIIFRRDLFIEWIESNPKSGYPEDESEL